jgi:hypothetical protein
MNERMPIEELIALPAAAPEPVAARAPSTLKSRIYSRLVEDQAANGPLLSLTMTKASGRALCIFEDLVQIAPVGEPLKRKNCCRVCHARVLAERIEGAPIYWPHCPYVRFQNQ